MRAPALVALGIVAYGVFLAAAIPASFVASRLPAIPGIRIQVTEASGTLWNGRGRAIVTPQGAGPIALDAIAWRFLPARLAGGRLAFDTTLAAGGMEAALEIARSFGAWHVRGLEARGDAKAIALVLPIAVAWRPSGALAISGPTLDWDERVLRGELAAEWREAAMAVSEVRPLGSYRAEYKSQGDRGRLTLSTLSGPLRISGEGTVDPPFRVSLAGEARAEGPMAKALEPVLDLLGPRRPDGARAIQWRIP